MDGLELGGLLRLLSLSSEQPRLASYAYLCFRSFSSFSVISSSYKINILYISPLSI